MIPVALFALFDNSDRLLVAYGDRESAELAQQAWLSADDLDHPIKLVEYPAPPSELPTTPKLLATAAVDADGEPLGNPLFV